MRRTKTNREIMQAAHRRARLHCTFGRVTYMEALTGALKALWKAERAFAVTKVGVIDSNYKNAMFGEAGIEDADNLPCVEDPAEIDFSVDAIELMWVSGGTY